MPVSAFQIIPSIKNYHWGKKGENSLIARLINEPKADLNYAELWYGAHPTSSSFVVTSPACSLSELMSSDSTALLGTAVNSRFNGNLPFLFKVLSIAEPLSIQTHPDLKTAARLHVEDPENYPDQNHKPEIAIALSELELLHGFRPLAEILTEIESHTELKKFFGAELLSTVTCIGASEAIKRLFSSILLAASDHLAQAIEALLVDINRKSLTDRSDRELMFLRLYQYYGAEDPGVLISLLMNHIRLHPFQAIYTAPNVLHAYLQGDIVECMATSDNVVRGGLTPKFKDKQTLIAILNFESSLVPVILPTAVKGESGWSQYKTAVSEFAVEYFSGSGEFQYSQINTGPRIYICLSGQGALKVGEAEHLLQPGVAVFLPDTVTDYNVEVSAGQVFRVYVPHGD